MRYDDWEIKYENWVREVLVGGTDYAGAAMLYPICEILQLESEEIVDALCMVDSFWKRSGCVFNGSFKVTCLRCFLVLWCEGKESNKMVFRATARLPFSLINQLINHFSIDGIAMNMNREGN